MKEWGRTIPLPYSQFPPFITKPEPFATFSFAFGSRGYDYNLHPGEILG